MKSSQNRISRNNNPITRVFEVLDQYEKVFPDMEVALGIKRDKMWELTSPKEYVETTNYISYALIKLGIMPGDKVAIISTNRPEWNMLDMAIMQAGAITVPVYPTISQDDYKYIANHSEMKMAIVEGHEVMTKFCNILPETPNLKLVYTFIDRKTFPYLAQLIQLGKDNPNPEELLRRKEQVKSEDCCTIMYTSGTTGLPKGVMLSHKNIVSQILSLRHIPHFDCERALSYLPLCHAYERLLVFMYQYLGISVYYVQNLGAIGENIKDVSPHIMTTVPRLLEKIYDKVEMSSRSLPPFRKKIFRWAVGVAEEYRLQEVDRTMWYNVRHYVANILVYKKILSSIGGDFKNVISGAAKLQPRLAAFFSAIGIPIFEGYGATETSPVIAVSCRDLYGREAGTVGFPVDGVEVKITENNEIICRGDNVMMGYYKAPDLTAEVIDEEGWFHTGDTGRITERGQVIVSGRIKSLFKTSMGKYINPQVIEDKFCESPLIENMVVVGENQKFAAALIVPDFNYLKAWCREQNIEYTTPASIVKHVDVLKGYSKEVAKYNATLGATEQIKKFELIPDEWTQQNDMITPTMKVKRFMAQKRYAQEIERLFM